VQLGPRNGRNDDNSWESPTIGSDGVSANIILIEEIEIFISMFSHIDEWSNSFNSIIISEWP
jgi:hypothetical protein